MNKKYICNRTLRMPLTPEMIDLEIPQVVIFTINVIYETADDKDTMKDEFALIDDAGDIHTISESGWAKYFEPVECCSCYYYDERNSICEEECIDLSGYKYAIWKDIDWDDLKKRPGYNPNNNPNR